LPLETLISRWDSGSKKRKQYQTYVVIHSGNLASPNFCLQPECALFSEWQKVY
jgi:hypothetical protein